MAVKATFDADFGKFVSELTKVDVKLREFEPSADRASAKLQRMADSLNGNKLLEQAGIAVGAINRIEGGVKALNDGELRKYGTLIDAATEKLVRQGRDVPAAMAQVKAAIDQARQPMATLSQAAHDSGRGFDLLQATAIGAVAGIAQSLTTRGVAALRQFAGDAFETGGKVADLSAKTGLSTDAIQRFSYAADQTGTSIDTLSGASLKLSRNLVEGNTATRAAVDALGLSLSSLQASGPEQSMLAVADAVKAVEDPMERVRLATDLFGRSGAELLPAIESGLRGLSDEAAHLGVVINEDAVAALDNMGDAWDRLQLRARAATATIIGDTLSDIEHLGAAWGAWQGEAAGAVDGVTERVTVLQAGVRALTGVLEGWRSIDFALETASGSPRGSTFQQTLDSAPIPVRGFKGADVSNNLAGRDKKDPFAFDALMASGREAAKAERAQWEKLEAQRDRLAEQSRQKQAVRDQQRIQERNRLTGRADLIDAQRLMGNVFGQGGVGVSALDNKTALAVFDKLVDAKAIAARLQPQLVAGFDTALTQLSANAGVLRRVTQDAGKKIVEGIFDRSALRAGVITGVTTLEREISQQLTEMTRRSPAARQSTLTAGEGLIRSALDPASLTTDARSFAGSIGEANMAALYGTLDRTVRRTNDWSTSVRGVSQAFANLSQISGGLEPVTRTIGMIAGASDAAGQLVDSLASSFKGLGDDWKDSKAAQAIGGGLAGVFTGFQLGGTTTSRAGGALRGAAGGAAAGLAFGGIGAGVGAIAGAAGGYFGAAAAASDMRKAKDLQMETLVAQYGTLDVLLETVGALGLHQQTFLERYYGEPKEFAKGVTDLNNALTREKHTADALAKSLEKVQKAQGVLSRGDRAQLVDPRAGGPTEDLAKQFKSQQTDSLLGGLDRILQQKGPLSASLVKSVGQSFPAALAALEQQGASPIEALKTLMPLLDQFRAKAVESGMGSTPGFDALNNQLAILKDERLGPLIERASGAGQALGALSNLNLLDEDTFSGFAASITESVAGMDLLSDTGQNAMRLIRGPLQNVWQLQKDFGYEVDESTQKLLDQAEASGLIGDKFRPAEQQLLAGIDRVVDRLDTLIDTFTTDLVDDATTGAGQAGRNILDAFDRVRPRIRIEYEYDTPETGAPPAGPMDPSRRPGTGSTAAQRATASSQGGDIYMDGERVGYHTLRHAGAFADVIGA